MIFYSFYPVLHHPIYTVLSLERTYYLNINSRNDPKKIQLTITYMTTHGNAGEYIIEQVSNIAGNVSTLFSEDNLEQILNNQTIEHFFQQRNFNIFEKISFLTSHTPKLPLLASLTVDFGQLERYILDPDQFLHQKKIFNDFFAQKNQLEYTILSRFYSEISALITSIPYILIYSILLFLLTLIFIPTLSLVGEIIKKMKQNAENATLLNKIKQDNSHFEECFACGHIQWVKNIHTDGIDMDMFKQHDHSLSVWVQTSTGLFTLPHSVLYNRNSTQQSSIRTVTITSKSRFLTLDENQLFYPRLNNQQNHQSDDKIDKNNNSALEFSKQLHSVLDNNYQSTSATSPISFVCCREVCKQLNHPQSSTSFKISIPNSILSRLSVQNQKISSPNPQLTHPLPSTHPILHNPAILPPVAPILCGSCIEQQELMLLYQKNREKLWFRQQSLLFIKSLLDMNGINHNILGGNEAKRIKTQIKGMKISMGSVLKSLEDNHTSQFNNGINIDALIEELDIPLWMLPPPPKSFGYGNDQNSRINTDLIRNDLNNVPNDTYKLCKPCEHNLKSYQLQIVAYNTRIQNPSLTQTNSNIQLSRSNSSNRSFTDLSQVLEPPLSSYSCQNDDIDDFLPLIRLKSGNPVKNGPNSPVSLNNRAPMRRLRGGLDAIQLGRRFGSEEPDDDGSGLSLSLMRQNNIRKSVEINNSPDNQLDSRHFKEKYRTSTPNPKSPTLPLDIDSDDSIYDPPRPNLKPQNSNDNLFPTPNMEQNHIFSDKITLPIFSQFGNLIQVIFHITLLFLSLLVEPFVFVSYLLLYPIIRVIVSLLQCLSYDIYPQNDLKGTSKNSKISIKDDNSLNNVSNSIDLVNIFKPLSYDSTLFYKQHFDSIFKIINNYQNNDNSNHNSLQPNLNFMNGHNYINQWNGDDEDDDYGSPLNNMQNTFSHFPIHKTQSDYTSLQSSDCDTYDCQLSHISRQDQPPRTTPSNSKKSISLSMFSDLLYVLNIPLRAIQRCTSASNMRVAVHFAVVIFFIFLATTFSYTKLTLFELLLKTHHFFLSSRMSSSIYSTIIVFVQAIMNLIPPKFSNFVITLTKALHNSINPSHSDNIQLLTPIDSESEHYYISLLFKTVSWSLFLALLLTCLILCCIIAQHSLFTTQAIVKYTCYTIFVILSFLSNFVIKTLLFPAFLFNFALNLVQTRQSPDIKPTTPHHETCVSYGKPSFQPNEAEVQRDARNVLNFDTNSTEKKHLPPLAQPGPPDMSHLHLNIPDSDHQIDSDEDYSPIPQNVDQSNLPNNHQNQQPQHSSINQSHCKPPLTDPVTPTVTLFAKLFDYFSQFDIFSTKSQSQYLSTAPPNGGSSVELNDKHTQMLSNGNKIEPQIEQNPPVLLTQTNANKGINYPNYRDTYDEYEERDDGFDSIQRDNNFGILNQNSNQNDNFFHNQNASLQNNVNLRVAKFHGLNINANDNRSIHKGYNNHFHHSNNESFDQNDAYNFGSFQNDNYHHFQSPHNNYSTNPQFPSPNHFSPHPSNSYRFQQPHRYQNSSMNDDDGDDNNYPNSHANSHHHINTPYHYSHNNSNDGDESDVLTLNMTLSNLIVAPNTSTFMSDH